MVGLRDLGHQLDVQRLGEVLHVLLQVKYRCVHLPLVLPVVVRPFLLEFEIRARSRHQGIDEVDLNLIDVDNVRYVATGGVKRQIAVDCPIIRRTDLERTFDNLGCTRSQSQRDRFFDNFQVALRQKLAIDVLDSLLGSVDEHDLEKDVIMVHFSDGLGVDRIRVAGELVDFLVALVLQLAHEVGSFDASLAQLLRDVEVALCRILALELAELNPLVWLHLGQVVGFGLLVLSRAVRGEQLGVRLEELAEDGASELDQHVLHLGEVALALGLGQDAKADLHPLDVVPVSAHGCHLALLRLMLFEQGADDEDRVDAHLLVGQAQVALRLDCQLGECDGKAASQVVVLCVDQGAAEGQVGALVLDLSGSGRS